jgi:hypothetical protein
MADTNEILNNSKITEKLELKDLQELLAHFKEKRE